jgi:hypothetical protein
VRVEFLPLLPLLLVSAGPAAAAPCLKTPVLVAHAGPGHLGPDGPYEERLGFRLAAADRVWAEAGGLGGLDPEDRDSAPEVFLDDTYLGPLLSDFGEAWRSPQALRLGPGEHEFLVRCAQEGEGPLLRWRSLRVLGDSPCLPAPARAMESAPALPATCGKLRRSFYWPPRLREQSLVLPEIGGRFAASGSLVRLRQGERWTVLMKIPKGPDGGPLPLVVRFETPVQGRVRFLIWVDRSTRGPVGAVGYVPGRWQALTLSLCSVSLRLRFAGEPPLEYPCGLSSVEFEVAARDLELSLAPDRSSD